MAKIMAVHRAICYDSPEECLEENGNCIKAVRAIEEMNA